jgi:hypothetical protein
MKKNNIYLTEILLGLGLGLGYLTSLRFIGPVGVPEILTVIALIILVRDNPSALIEYKSKKEYYFKFF